MVEFGKKGNQNKFIKYISLRNSKEKKKLNVQCEEISFSAEIIEDEIEKELLFEKMNYKYKFGGKDMPILRIYSVSIKLPDEF